MADNSEPFESNSFLYFEEPKGTYYHLVRAHQNGQTVCGLPVAGLRQTDAAITKTKIKCRRCQAREKKSVTMLPL